MKIEENTVRKTANYGKFVVNVDAYKPGNNKLPSVRCAERIRTYAGNCQAKEGFYQWNLVTNYNM